ncbi:MAG TPA: right-handed parallel beta-helix repeat-containing protein, partial [Tepidisphaeraceae bacterium]|nr:right-handed parallel beta-helix repeat-containing protein [Tepidisphaeraceae bacterium]
MIQDNQGLLRNRNLHTSLQGPQAKSPRRRRGTSGSPGSSPLCRPYAAEPLEQRLLLAVLYVDLNAPGPVHDGSSWDSAYADLQPALINAKAGDQIRIAGGTYKPTVIAHRAQSFQLKTGVALYGGYGGHNAADPNLRDIQLSPTILSGEIGDPSTIADNSYQVVSAMSVDSTSILDGLTITAGNAMDRDGGGMYNYHSYPTLTNCTFIGNSANSGGGMYNVSSSPTLTNCSFVGNSATYGGGMYNVSSSAPTLTNCSFAGNSATYGGGMYNSSSAPTLTNCIVLGNSSAIDNYVSTYPGYESTPTVTYSLIEGGYSGIGNLDANPQFVRSPWPGPDGTFGTADDDYGDLRLRSGSPAINAGRNAALPSSVTIDLAGHPRIQDGTVDLGAYEGAILVPAPKTIYVDQNATGTNTGRSWSDAYTSLQSALAASVDGDTIRIADGTYKPTTTTDRAINFALRNAVAIYGGYAGAGAADPDARDIALYPTILSGDIGKPGDKSDNSYHVATGTAVGRSTILDGLTITLGNANSLARYGGGLYLLSSSPMLTHCSFVGNSASAYGGGMYNAFSSPTLANCSFAGNSAPSGGGMANYAFSSPTLTNCSFVGNSAESYGGGMCNSSSAPTLTHCSFAGNSASSGGAIYNVSYSSSSPTLTNCILWGNSSASRNGVGSTSTVTFSLIEGGYSGIGNLDADPQFVRSPWPGPDGTFGTADDDYGDLRLRADSPVL